MKKPHLWVLTVCLAAGIIIFFLSRPQSQSASTAKEESQSQTQAPDTTNQSTATSPVKPDPLAIQAFANALMKPISFWGKIVDENGIPIAEAKVQWSANNNPNPYGLGTKGQTISGPDGMFSVKSHGLGLYVEASKEGYYRVPTEVRGKRGSYGGFSNAEKLGNTDSPMGTQKAPATFVLRKIGQAIPLIHWGKHIKISRDGTPIEISLENGQPIQGSSGNLKVEAWTNDQAKNERRRYDWRCRVSVPDGGLIERKGRFDFEAPENGYQPSDEINMPQTAERWSPQVSREYFVKLADGRYARIRFEMVAGGDHFFTISTYLNPTFGSRNLEFDPQKQAQSR